MARLRRDYPSVPGAILVAFRALAARLPRGRNRYRCGHFDGSRPVWQTLSPKRKGPQLALEPLNGQGIAGYVPEPELWMRPRDNDYVVPGGPHPGRTYML